MEKSLSCTVLSTFSRAVQSFHRHLFGFFHGCIFFSREGNSECLLIFTEEMFFSGVQKKDNNVHNRFFHRQFLRYLYFHEREKQIHGWTSHREHFSGDFVLHGFLLGKYTSIHKVTMLFSRDLKNPKVGHHHHQPPTTKIKQKFKEWMATSY